jgi:hypothetical protein
MPRIRIFTAASIMGIFEGFLDSWLINFIGDSVLADLESKEMCRRSALLKK